MSDAPYASRHVSAPVVIPAHGFGRRMHALTGGDPKTLIEVAGVPILRRLLAVIADVGRDAIVLAQPSDELIPSYLASLKFSNVSLLRRNPCGYLNDLAWVFATTNSEVSVVNSDTVLPYDEAFEFLGTFLTKEAADLVVGQSAYPREDRPRAIRFVETRSGSFRLADPQDAHLPRASGVYHWREKAIQAACEFASSGTRTFHEFIPSIQGRISVRTFTFSGAVNVNTPEELSLAEIEARRWASRPARS